MHRLIVQLKEPLNASFCEAVVNLFGQCELIPMTRDICLLEGLKKGCSSEDFYCLLKFINTHTTKALLANALYDKNLQVQQLVKAEDCGLYTIEEPPTAFYSFIRVLTIYHVQLNCMLSPDEFDLVC